MRTSQVKSGDDSLASAQCQRSGPESMFLATVVWESNTYLCGSGGKARPAAGRERAKRNETKTCNLPIACARSGMEMCEIRGARAATGGEVQGAQERAGRWSR